MDADHRTAIEEALDNPAGGPSGAVEYDPGDSFLHRLHPATRLTVTVGIVATVFLFGDLRGPLVALLGEVVTSLVDASKTVVVITHDMHFVRDHADRVIGLRNGEVLLDGDPRSVFAQIDTLAETHVQPPAMAALGVRLGLDGPPLTVDEVVEGLP